MMRGKRGIGSHLGCAVGETSHIPRVTRRPGATSFVADRLSCRHRGLIVVPDLHGREQQEKDEQRDEDQVRHDSEEQSAEYGSGD